jgi:hypothetical protein
MLPVLLAAGAPTLAADKPVKDPWKLYLLRFEFDNDTYLGSDDAFSAGWSLQLHSRFDDTWHPGYAKWIGRFPGLGDDGHGGRVVRWAYGIGQLIITPTDISIDTPQPDDAPWAGILLASGSWSAYDNRRLGALQFVVGCMGPCSGAESVQKFIHNDLGFGEPPQGWDNQLAEKWLVNSNYEYRYKVFADNLEDYTPGRFANDFSVGGQVALGNFVTAAWFQVEYRLGWGVPQGFTKAPDPPGLGVMLDPVYFDPLKGTPLVSPWRSYFTLVGRAVGIAHLAPADGGPTVNGGEHPGLDAYPGQLQALIGYHLARVPFAIHLTYYKYFTQEKTGINGSSDWINLSFEWRF